MEQDALDAVMKMADEVQQGTYENVMEQLSSLAKEQLKWEERVKMLEEKLETAKKQVLKISGELIPQLLATSGLSEVKLDTGEKVVVKKGLSVTYKPEDSSKLFAFLKDNNGESIIKTSFDVGKVPDGVLDKIFDFLDTTVTTYETKIGVHKATLEKFIKELTAVDKSEEERQALFAEGRIKNLEDIPEFLNVYTYSKTKVSAN